MLRFFRTYIDKFWKNATSLVNDVGITLRRWYVEALSVEYNSYEPEKWLLHNYTSNNNNNNNKVF